MTDSSNAAARDFCLWGAEDFEFRVGIIGTGPGFKTIIDITTSQDYEEYLPAMRLSAVADPSPGESRKAYLDQLGIPLFSGWEEMLEVHPEINLLFELSTGRIKPFRLRKQLPESVSLIEHSSAIFFCSMYNLQQVNAACRINLEHHKGLLEAVLENIKEDVILLDKDWRVADMNKSVQDRTGKSKEDLLGKRCWKVQLGTKGGRFCQHRDKHCPVRATLAEGAKAEAMVTRVAADGHLRYYRIYSYPIFNQSGELSRVLVMRRDITSRTQKEKQVREREMLALLGEMSMYLAHEIRNPLCAIGGFSNALMAAPELSRKSRDKVRIIAEETRRLDDMLASILNFTRATGFETKEIDVNRLVEETAELMRHGYSPRGYRFDVRLRRDLPGVNGVIDTLKQVLINLMKNAVEATQAGGEIKVETGLEEDMVFIRVTDKGVGMTDREIDRAFNPFYTTKQTGYGLGLPMIKRAVEEMGGRVDLMSRVNRGTSVSLFLPPILESEDEERKIVSI